MTIYFSATTLWFYDDSDKDKYAAGIGWPDDATRIRDDEWKQYSQPAPAGLMLGVDGAGKPAWINIPQPTAAELQQQAERQKATLLSEANSITQALQTQLLLGIITDKDKASLTEWMRYVQKVQAVDTSSAPVTSWPKSPVNVGCDINK